MKTIIYYIENQYLLMNLSGETESWNKQEECIPSE